MFCDPAVSGVKARKIDNRHPTDLTLCSTLDSRPLPSLRLNRLKSNQTKSPLKFGGVMKSHFGRGLGQLLLCLLFVLLASTGSSAATDAKGLAVSIDARGNYAIGLTGAAHPVLTSGVAAQVGGTWLRSADYPHHTVKTTTAQGILGSARQWVVTFSGLTGKPDLVYQLRAYDQQPFVDLQTTLRNTTNNTVEVQALRTVDASGSDAAALEGPGTADRVLSDSFSEDRPFMTIHDLG